MSLQVRNPSTGLLERVAGFNDTDIALSPTSVNPVANKTIYAALAQKIDKTVNDLINYYKKSETYSQEEIRALIGAINTLTIEVVASLPTQDISTTTIYFVGPTSGKYDEYVYVNNAWVKLGDTEIDLSSYATKEYVATALQSYYTKTEIDTALNDYYDKDAVDDLLDTKQDVLTFDNQPTSGSSNPVTSAGIRTAISNAIVSSAGGSIIKVHHLDGGTVVGDTVTASKGSFSVSSTFDNNGDAIITGVGEIGTIQITATNGIDVGVAFINTPNFSLYSTTISYGVNYKSWLEAGGLNPSSYSSLDEVLEDEEAIRRLFTIHTSVDYLVSAIISDDNEDAIKIFNNNLCAKWISLRDYAMDTLSTNEHIVTMMEDADKYGYGEWALVPQIPTMTSNTAPYGEVTCDSFYAAGYEAYRAFDDSPSVWASNHVISPGSSASGWIKYKFIKPIHVNEMYLAFSGCELIALTIYGSNDDNNYTAISYISKSNGYYEFYNNDNSYQYYRVNLTQKWISTGTAAMPRLNTLQFYTWEPKGNVPVMTSNTAPYGTVSTSSYEQCSPYYAFDQNMAHGFISNRESSPCYIGYNFTNPIKLKKTTLTIGSTQNLGSTIITFKIQYSDDGSTWNDVPNASINVSKTTDTVYWQTYTILINNFDEYHLYYRVYSAQPLFVAGSYALVTHVQFYGREMGVSVPAMTSDTTPYGEAFGDPAAYSSNYDFYRVFDKNSSTQAAYINGATQGYFGYDFGRKVAIKYAAIYQKQGTRPTTIIYSDDKVNWTDACSVYSHAANTTAFIKTNDNAGEHRYWALRIVNSDNGNTSYMDFFGFDYSEYDWDTEHPRHYIFDHGVTPNETVSTVVGSGGTAYIGDSIVYAKSGSSSGVSYRSGVGAYVDVTNYTYQKCKLGEYYYATVAGNVCLIVTDTTITTGTVAALDTYGNLNIPNNFTLDVSSISGSYWCSVGAYGSSNYISAKEIWLE